jgi:glycosyltransferase involved in cell wall biosynthesis
LPARYRTLGFAAQIMSRGLWQRPDLIIASHLNFGVAARQLKLLAGTPYWLTAHGIEAWDITRPSLKAVLRHADRILAVSSYTRTRLLAEQQLDPARVVLLPNTVDADRFTPRPKPPHLLARYGLRPEQPVLLTVSRLVSSEQYKGYDKVIRALPAIQRAIPDVRYILVGKGDDRPRIEQLIDQVGAREYITLAGFVPDEELSDYYNLCDVFAMPSKREGFGIVFLEAMSCGKPTLAGNKDGSVDALCHGELGALVDPDDVHEVGATLVALLQRTYPHKLMYQPELLRQRMCEVYGFEQFKRNLSDLIDGFFTPADGARDSAKAVSVN